MYMWEIMFKQFHYILKFCIKVILFKLNFIFLHTIVPRVQISGVLDFFSFLKRKICVYLSLTMPAQTQSFSAIWNFVLQDFAQRALHQIFQ